MKKYFLHPLGIFIFILHAIYFFVALKTGNIYLVDSGDYLSQVKNISEHNCWYANDWYAPVWIDYFTIRPPLYAYFILSLKSVFPSDYLILLVQNLISIFNIFLIWKLLEKNKVKQKAINVAVILALLFFPSQMIHANFVMSEILLQLFVTLIFYFSVLTLNNSTIKNIFWISVFISLAMLTKPVALYFGVFLFVFFLIILWKSNKKILLPFLLIPLTYHLLCLQNQHITGYYHFSSIKILADVRVNSRYVLASKYGADSSAKFETQLMNEANLISDYKERYQFIEMKCHQVYFQNKSVFVKLYLKGIASTIVDPGRFDLNVFFNLQNSTSIGLLHRLNTEGINSISKILKDSPVIILLFLLLILVWNIFVFIAFGIFIFHKKINLLLLILVLIFVGYFVTATGISGLCRYRVPVFPEIIFVLAFVLNNIFMRNKLLLNSNE